MHYGIADELGHITPPRFDRTIRNEAKGYDRARITFLEAIKGLSTADIPADNSRGAADPVDVLHDRVEAIELYMAVSAALNGDKDHAVKLLCGIASKVAQSYAFAHSDAFEDGAQG